MEALYPEDPGSIGPYRLLGRLGEGGMGRVYLGRSSSGRMVAVKVVHGELARDPHFRRRFRAEIEAAQRVSGMWTAPVLGHDIESAVPWVATGYVAGPPLREVVDTLHGPLPEHSVWALAYGLASALMAVHRSGLIHRDLKPSNVMVTLEGPKVIDFGIARSVDASVVTRTGGMVGSPGYMPPEQIKGGSELTGAADVFALGALLAYAATGKSPFSWDGAQAPTVIYRVMNDPPNLGPENGRLKGDLRTLVLHCLAKDPRDRPSLAGIPPLAEKRAGTEYWLPSGLTARLGQVAANLLAFDGPETDRPSSSWGPRPPSAWDPRPVTGAQPIRQPATSQPTVASFGHATQAPAEAPPAAVVPPLPSLPPPQPQVWTPPTGQMPPDQPAHRRDRRRYALAAAAGAVVLAVTSGVIAANLGGGGETPRAGATGPESSGGDSSSDPLDAGANPSNADSTPLIGDPLTANVCALVTTDDVERFGPTKEDRDYGNFNVCKLSISPNDDTRVDVNLALQVGREPEGNQEIRPNGSISIIEDPPEDEEECGLTLVPPDSGANGIVVEIRAVQVDGELTDGRAGLCNIADDAADAAAGVMNQGGIPRRPEPYPEDSLARMNACDLIGNDALAAAGLEDIAPDAGVADWECEWDDDDAGLEAEISFYRDNDAPDGERTQFSGYDAIVDWARDGDGTCSVFVVYRDYGAWDTGTAWEMVRLDVEAERPTAAVCGLAEDLAASAASHLPPR